MRLPLIIERHRIRLLTTVALCATLLVTVGILSTLGPPRSYFDDSTLIGATVPAAAPELPPAWPMSLSRHAVREVEGEFRSGDTFSSILRDAGVSPSLVEEIAAAIRADFDVQKIRAGRRYNVYFDGDDELMLFRYRPTRERALVVAHGRQGWLAKEMQIPFDVRPRFVHADIRGSLEGAISATWVTGRDAITLSNKLAEIFAWDIDFAADLRVNDKLDVIVEQRFIEGEFIGFGEVLAAELTVRGVPYSAVRYARAGGRQAYFTPDGASLQRAFLRSPVTYQRISSRFSYRRMHPILNVVRPHRGVDYVAPAGTAVSATADGTVVYVGRNGQAGNHVRIRHGGSYESSYLHLRGFAEGLQVGSRVHQGEVIGFVGSTGLATSAHLHYQLERNNEFVDPLKIDFPAADPLPPSHRDEFARQRDRWMGLLRQGQLGPPTVLAGSSD